MLFGLSIGLGVALVVYLRSGGPTVAGAPTAAAETGGVARSPPESGNASDAAAPPPRSGANRNTDADVDAAGDGDEPALSFFDDLSKSEVLVDGNEFDFGNDSPRVVFIQAGAFRDIEDADARQASLALLGYESHIDTAIVNGSLWFRVLIGPLTERGEINSTVRRLRGGGIETVLRPVSN
jgi:SPOR domain